ncbi:hypothetical protein SAMN04244548_02981 [Paracoccus pantotrophus]|nr:hypothetical protein SAMN04244548_02981 [Paracoccus pantotrophus]
MTTHTVELAALTVAAAAIAGRVAARDAAVLRGLAAEALDETDPLRVEIEAFARRRPAVQGDPKRMGRLGKQLGRAVELSRLGRGAQHG